MKNYRVVYKTPKGSKDENIIEQKAFSKDRARIVAKKALYDMGVRDVEIVKVQRVEERT